MIYSYGLKPGTCTSGPLVARYYGTVCVDDTIISYFKYDIYQYFMFSPRRCTPTSGIILEQFYLLEAFGALSFYQRKQKIRKMSQQNNRLSYYRYRYPTVLHNVQC